MGKYLVKNNRAFQRCTNCVMDTTDSKIVFDAEGVCDFCNDFKKNILPKWKPGENSAELDDLAAKIREAGVGKKYDCIIGLSGGADSSYLCYSQYFLGVSDWFSSGCMHRLFGIPHIYSDRTCR